MSTTVDLLPAASERLRRYGMNDIGNRHIADGRDGLKPVQRRVLWAMYNMGVTSADKHAKQARVMGECFPAGTMVSTPNGPVAIEYISIGDTVLTSRGERKVIQLYANPPARMLQVSLGDGKVVVCTRKQKFKIVKDGIFSWKKACDLTTDDEVVVEI